MVTRNFTFGAGRLPRSRSSFPIGAALATFVAVAPLTAQAPPISPPQEPTPAVAPAAAPAAPLVYGRVIADNVALRCWPSTAAAPPAFEDVLAKDQVVQLGRSENGFRAVVVPLGPLGYVSQKFTETAPDGTVKSKGSKVAYRYRPRSTEAPVMQLEEGTPLHVVGEQPDWYQVRVPTVEAWVLEAEVQVGDPADAALAAGYAEWKQKQQAAVKLRLDQIAAVQKRQEQDKADLAAVDVVQQAFATELKKPVTEQQFAPLEEALGKLSATLAADSAGVPAVEALKKRIETQKWIAEATAVRAEKPVPVTDVTPPLPQDELEKFQSIGWLHYESRLAAPGVYYLEKGGRRLYLISCSSGRYDLALFVDCEVAVIGPRRRPVVESLSVIDVERLEVRGTTAR
ncbi:MAG: SH3 domain-containing protein [Planctomycetota bacterium]